MFIFNTQFLTLFKTKCKKRPEFKKDTLTIISTNYCYHYPLEFIVRTIQLSLRLHDNNIMVHYQHLLSPLSGFRTVKNIQPATTTPYNSDQIYFNMKQNLNHITFGAPEVTSGA